MQNDWYWVVRVVYFWKLSSETNNDKFSLRIVQSKNICGHPGENVLQSGMEASDTLV